MREPTDQCAQHPSNILDSSDELLGLLCFDDADLTRNLEMMLSLGGRA